MIKIIKNINGFKQLFYDIAEEKDLNIIEMEVDKDHIHLQIEIPPNIAVSNAVQILKLNSSIRLKKKFKFIRDMYIEEDGIWSVGYFSSTIWLNEEMIKRYIEEQGKKDFPVEQASFDFE